MFNKSGLAYISSSSSSSSSLTASSSLISPLLFIITIFIIVIIIIIIKTTIEFYINLEEGRDARLNNRTFKNPYDKGWRRNLRRVFGDVPLHKALLLSYRLPPEPEYPFLPTDDMINKA